MKWFIAAKSHDSRPHVIYIILPLPDQEQRDAGISEEWTDAALDRGPVGSLRLDICYGVGIGEGLIMYKVDLTLCVCV